MMAPWHTLSLRGFEMKLPRLLAAAVVLEVVMLIALPADAARWGKKDKVALESWSAQESVRWNDSARQSQKCIVLTLDVRNQTDRAVKAWRAKCVVKDPYDKKIFDFVANGDAKVIAGGQLDHSHSTFSSTICPTPRGYQM
jgi:hypothetical protein